MAQIAKTGAEKAPTTNTASPTKPTTDNVAELRQRAADQAGEATARHGAETVQRAAGAAGEAQRELTQLSAAGTTELGRMFVELASQQSQQNLETLKALSGAVDWNRFAKAVDWQQVLEIQSAYFRASLERSAQLTRRYVEVSQAMVNSAASATRRQAKKAA